jgi:proline iminopeptidase
VKAYSQKEKAILIGHSWGGILAIDYIGRYPDKISHAVIAEPGMLNQTSAKAFVKELKEYQTFSDTLFFISKFIQAGLVKSHDGHERFDYVMTEMLNRSKPGKPYQCEGKSLPPNLFVRGGFESFNQILKPVFDDPNSFKHDFAKNIKDFKEKILFMSSSCSFIGYDFQEKYHIPLMPKQTQHIKAPEMGHNFFTTHPEWSKEKILNFLND